MTNTILVTGATGNVGGQVVKQLAAAGANVRAAVRSTSRAEGLTGVELVEFDFNKPETVQAAFEGADKVFLATPLVPNMVEIEATSVEVAKKAGVKHIVKLSVMGADSQPEMILAQMHREGEKKIEDSGISYTFFRPNSFHQNYITYTGNTIKSQNAFYLPLGDEKISFVDTRDIGAVAVAVLTQSGHEGKTYEITGSEALSNAQLAEILSNVLGRQINYVDIPEDSARNAMIEIGMPELQIDMVLGLYAAQKAGAYSSVSPVVEQITGKKPITFEQFVRDYAQVFTG
ncbi:SDR family oxidoreductase [Argonema antarcticum]|uniref:SDR family oxidoreductase n=1 Tax=Argonema antarcticum TaxID=2942763 RepID=UPI002012893F|nr:SDR family oxidoreductase [Argonema antarcticum]MCL1474477.1 SDR family oxidoreductase [Argonema antarcticum A004/B2]